MDDAAGDVPLGRSAEQELTVVITALLAGSARLVQATSEDAVAQAVLDACLAAVGATGGAVRRLDVERRVLVPLLARNLDLGGGHWAFSLDDLSPIADAATSQRVVCLTGPEEIAALPPGTIPSGLAALVYVPMLISGRTVGTIGLGFDEPRALSQGTLDSLLTFAHSAALALERTRLEAGRRAAMSAAAEAAARTEALHRITRAFSRSLTVTEVIDVALDALVDVLRPGSVTAVLRAGDRLLRVVAGRGRPVQADQLTLPLDAARPICAVVRDGQDRWYGDRASFEAGFGPGEMPPFGHAAGIVALVADGEPVGAIAVVFAQPRSLDTADRDFVVSIGMHCSEALRRARHYEDARRSAQRRLALQRAAERFSCAQSTSALSLATLAAMREALGNAIDFAIGFIEDGVIELLHTDRSAPDGPLRSWSVALSARRPVAAVARDGKARYFEDRAAVDAEFGADNDAPAGQVSGAVLPIVVDQRVVGVLGVSFDRPNRLFDLDRELLETLATLCAEAERRIRLSEIERRADARTAALNRVTEALSRSITVDEVIVAAVNALAEALEPETAFAAVRLGARHLHQWVWERAGGEVAPRRPAEVDATTPIVNAVLADGRARFYKTAAEMVADLGGDAAAPLPLAAGAFVALGIDDEAVGLLGVTFAAGRRIPDTDRQLLGVLATLCSEAMRRARHFEQAQLAAMRYEELFASYERLFRANPMPMVVYDGERRVLASNQALEEAFGYGAEELATMTVLQLVADGEMPPCSHAVDDADRATHEHLGVMRMRRRDGSTFFMDVSLHDAATFAGRPARVGLLIDQTARVEAEEANRALQARVVAVAEEERRRLAGELHDGPVQQLSIASMRLSALRRLGAGDSGWSTQVDKIERDVLATVEELRTMMQQLYPQALEHLTLAEAIHAAVPELPWAAGLHVQVEDTLRCRLPATVQAALYRVAMEALQNVHKHAVAGEVTIELRHEGDAVVLCITDDGVGIDEAATTRPGHLGLPSMRDRLSLLGGECRIERAGAAGGTVVQARVPLAPSAQERAGADRSPRSAGGATGCSA